MRSSKAFETSWQIIMVMLIIVNGIESSAAEIGRIKDKSDFTITQKHATVRKMTDFHMSLSPTLIKKDGMMVKIAYRKLVTES